MLHNNSQSQARRAVIPTNPEHVARAGGKRRKKEKSMLFPTGTVQTSRTTCKEINIRTSETPLKFKGNLSLVHIETLSCRNHHFLRHYDWMQDIEMREMFERDSIAPQQTIYQRYLFLLYWRSIASVFDWLINRDVEQDAVHLLLLLKGIHT